MSKERGLLENQIEKLEEKITSLVNAQEECALAVAESDQALAGRDALILALNKKVAVLEKELSHVVDSQSWRLTRPLLIIRRRLDSR